MSVSVRRAEPGDADRLAEFAMQLVEQHVSHDRVRFARIATIDGMKCFYGEQTAAKDVAILVAEINGQIIGFAYVGYESKNYAELAVSTAWLHDTYVEESARQSGAGQALIKAAAEAAGEFGAGKLLLSVAVKNSAAHGFFEHLGFKATMHEMMLVITG